MKNTPKKVYGRVYIHAAKTQVKEGWVLMIHSMDAFSEFAFETVSNKTVEINIDVLNQLFDNILKDYKPIFHPKQIVFVTNLPEGYSSLIQQTKAAHHKFIYNKEGTAKAMQGLLSNMKYKMVEL